MAMKCFLCHKGRMVGRQHKHHPGVAGGRWKRRAPKTLKIFKPNLHWTKIKIEGTPKRVRLCTKCLRIVKEDLKPKPSVVSSSALSQPV